MVGKYVGCRAKITANESSHHFEIGTQVVLTCIYNEGDSQEHWAARDSDDALWFVNESEFELMEENYARI